MCFATMYCLTSNAQDKNMHEDTDLLRKYIDTKIDKIVFDSTNIKQYWIDNTVTANNNLITILTDNERQSIPLKIQFANVNEAQDCTIDVITEEPTFSFSVLNTQMKIISESPQTNAFLNYQILSKTVHLENTKDLSIILRFESKSNSVVKINKIVVSFSDNKNSLYKQSPGKIVFDKNNTLVTYAVKEEVSDFVVKGKRTQVYSNNYFFTNNNTLKIHAIIKNIGNCPCKVFVGYLPYLQNEIIIDPGNFPYKENTPVLNVISINKSDKTIIVDKYPEWEQGCLIAYDVESDLSDVPNTNLLSGVVVNITKTGDENTSILLNKEIDECISTGSKIRIHGLSGRKIYPNITILQPNEEKVFDSETQIDKNLLQFNDKAIPRGVYCVKPLIFSFTADPGSKTYSLNPQFDNIIHIKEFSLSY